MRTLSKGGRDGEMKKESETESDKGLDWVWMTGGSREQRAKRGKNWQAIMAWELGQDGAVTRSHRHD